MSMEISNAAQAGPSHGLLDIIFGTAAAEKPSSQEAEDPLMALVKALERQNRPEEEEKSEFIWGEMESAATMTTGEQMIPILPQTSPMGVAPKAAAGPELDQEMLNMVSGNVAAAKLLQSLEPDAQALKSLKAGDPQAIIRLIETRKQELRSQMPSLALLEKAVERDGLEKVASTKDVQQLLAKLEHESVLQEKSRRGIATEDFLLAKLAKDQKLPSTVASPSAVTNGILNPNELNKTIPNSSQALPTDPLQRSQAIEQRAADVLQQVDRGAPVGDTLLPNAAASTGIGTAIGDVPNNLSSVDIHALKNADRRSEIAGKLANSISFIAKKGGGEMSILINPKELGEIHLRVRTSGHGVEVQMITQHQDVAQALRASGADLADALNNHNLSLSGLDVSIRGGDAQMNADTGGQNPQNMRHSFENQERPGQHDAKSFAHSEGDSRRGGRGQSNSETLTGSDDTAKKTNSYSVNGRLDTRA